MVCFFLSGITLFLFCLNKALHQKLIESEIRAKGNSSMTCSVEKLDKAVLLQEPLNIRVEKWMGAATTDNNPAERPNLSIILEQSNPGSLHGTKTPARAVIVISGASIRNVTLGDIIDQLRAIPDPLSNPPDGGTKKEESNLGKKVQPISGKVGLGKDHIHSLANVEPCRRAKT